MKLRTILLFAISSFALSACGGSQPSTQTPAPGASAGAAQADDDEDDGMPHLHGFLAEMDAAKDGKVTLDEAKAAAVARFAAADTNKDGELDASEMEAMHKARMPPGAPRGMGRIDKVGDGAISRDVAPPRLLARFDELDADKDGKLTKDEMAAGRKNHPQGGPHRAAPEVTADRWPAWTPTATARSPQPSMQPRSRRCSR
jgi:hypothetical protein